MKYCRTLKCAARRSPRPRGTPPYPRPGQARGLGVQDTADRRSVAKVRPPRSGPRPSRAGSMKAADGTSPWKASRWTDFSIRKNFVWRDPHPLDDLLGRAPPASPPAALEGRGSSPSDAGDGGSSPGTGSRLTSIPVSRSRRSATETRARRPLARRDPLLGLGTEGVGLQRPRAIREGEPSRRRLRRTPEPPQLLVECRLGHGRLSSALRPSKSRGPRSPQAPGERRAGRRRGWRRATRAPLPPAAAHLAHRAHTGRTPLATRAGANQGRRSPPGADRGAGTAARRGRSPRGSCRRERSCGS